MLQCQHWKEIDKILNRKRLGKLPMKIPPLKTLKAILGWSLWALMSAILLFASLVAHYNEVAPHSTLAMLAPTTFYQQSLMEPQTKTT